MKSLCKPTKPFNLSLRALAILEGVKGSFVLIAGLGLLHFSHGRAAQAAEELVQQTSLVEPALAHHQMFQHITDSQLQLIALATIAFAVLRFIEAWGLLRERRWAEWLALISGSVFLPIEVYEFIHTGHWAAIAVFAVNASITTALALRLFRVCPSCRNSKCKASGNGRRMVLTNEPAMPL